MKAKWPYFTHCAQTTAQPTNLPICPAFPATSAIRTTGWRIGLEWPVLCAACFSVWGEGPNHLPGLPPCTPQCHTNTALWQALPAPQPLPMRLLWGDGGGECGTLTLAKGQGRCVPCVAHRLGGEQWRMWSNRQCGLKGHNLLSAFMDGAAPNLNGSISPSCSPLCHKLTGW